jgi:universal stress protein E
MSSSSWKTILVAVGDPDARKQVAIAKAARIAARTGASITLFHAFSMPLPPAAPTDSETLLRRVAKERLDQLNKRARALRAVGLDVECEVAWDFPAAHAIVRRVLESAPDLVVAQSHRHSKLARWFLTNSDWDLIRECPCPVWFVKHERLPKKSLILTAVDPTHAHAKPSGLDDRLLQAATNVMRQLGGRLAVIHVEDTAATTRKSMAVQSAATIEAIDRLMERNGVEADRIVRAGKPADVLTTSATQLNADLLVMGAVSRSGLSLSHIGNTAEAVIDAVACDVLVVKPRLFKTAVSRKHPNLPSNRASNRASNRGRAS